MRKNALSLYLMLSVCVIANAADGMDHGHPFGVYLNFRKNLSFYQYSTQVTHFWCSVTSTNSVGGTCCSCVNSLGFLINSSKLSKKS